MITDADIVQALLTIKGREKPTCVYIKPMNITLGCCTPSKAWTDPSDFPPCLVGTYTRTCDLGELTEDVRAIEKEMIANPPPRGRFQQFSPAKPSKQVAA